MIFHELKNIFEVKIEDILNSKQIVNSLPKVLLHDHLDGGLRPHTIIELAQELKYKKLPTKDLVELGEWFHCGVNKGNLVEYL